MQSDYDHITRLLLSFQRLMRLQFLAFSGTGSVEATRTPTACCGSPSRKARTQTYTIQPLQMLSQFNYTAAAATRLGVHGSCRYDRLRPTTDELLPARQDEDAPHEAV